ncbi:MAG: FixH family protein [Crocinitomicaceae bacterium]|nr:FixH family protein [Crocinitomicaceae bacterium]
MNWGKGITIGIVLFVGFILSFVYRAFQQDFDLVRDDYYEHEAHFETEKINRSNYDHLEEKIEITQREKGVCFQFPSNISSTTKGTIEFYRPDGKIYDRTFDLELDQNNQQWLDYEHFVEGYYDVTITWNKDQRGYMFEDNIQF